MLKKFVFVLALMLPFSVMAAEIPTIDGDARVIVMGKKYEMNVPPGCKIEELVRCYDTDGTIGGSIAFLEQEAKDSTLTQETLENLKFDTAQGKMVHEAMIKRLNENIDQRFGDPVSTHVGRRVSASGLWVLVGQINSEDLSLIKIQIWNKGQVDEVSIAMFHSQENVNNISAMIDSLKEVE